MRFICKELIQTAESRLSIAYVGSNPTSLHAVKAPITPQEFHSLKGKRLDTRDCGSIPHDEFFGNRDRKRRFKKGKFWCGGCDMDLVGEWRKCSTCGRRNGRKRNKK